MGHHWVIWYPHHRPLRSRGDVGGWRSVGGHRNRNRGWASLSLILVIVCSLGNITGLIGWFRAITAAAEVRHGSENPCQENDDPRNDQIRIGLGAGEVVSTFKRMGELSALRHGIRGCPRERERLTCVTRLSRICAILNLTEAAGVPYELESRHDKTRAGSKLAA